MASPVLLLFRVHGLTHDLLKELPFRYEANSPSLSKTNLGSERHAPPREDLPPKSSGCWHPRRFRTSSGEPSELQAAYIPEKLCPPPPNDTTIPADQLIAIEASLSQSSHAGNTSTPDSPIDHPMQSIDAEPHMLSSACLMDVARP